MLMLFALLLLCYGVGNAHCSTVHENSTDLHELLDFKQNITSDPNEALISWNTSIHYCRWKYVYCTQMRPWRVTGLNLTGQNLEGQISSSLASLTFLSSVDLSLNRFFGEIPPFNGLQQLEILFLYGNSLQGVIPDSLTNCSKLRNLDLSSNQLSGTIPPKIGSLSNLEVLVLHTNQLQGSIPHGIWQSSKMIDLLLGNNNLSGEIPQEINMSSLQYLSLEFNNLSKALPSNIGDALPSLQWLTLEGNSFEGQIPASLGYASGLQEIDLSQNSFTGPIPASLGKLSSLNKLNLDYNNLEAWDTGSWEFLHALRKCSYLTMLSLYSNRLQGNIPESVGTLSPSLTSLSFGRNQLTGIVPPTIGNLQNLISLGLENNNLSGAIDEWIGKLKHLQGLYLSSNNFTGPVPSSIGNLTQLTRLLLDRNEFGGPIPLGIENIAQLLVLNLSYNNLQGNIPLGIGNLTQLTELYLSSNKLTGVIPYGLGKCQSLGIIKMDQNFLIGDIPASLGDLKGLTLLNLSYNNLSGNIPITLNNLPIIHNLDLSFNHLEGQVPTSGVLANATVVSLYGNRGLCGGAASLRIPSCPTVSKKFGRQYYLIRVLIPIFGFMSLVLLVYLLLVVKKTPREKYISLTSFGQDFLKVSYNDLAQATRDFSESNLVGRGSYGSVYRGKLKEQKVEVAVKVFNLEMRGAERSFMSECETLRSIQHRNLLPIITACSTVDNNGDVFKALVYEYIHNGSLDAWLHSNDEGKAPNKHLSLTQRISIAVNIADALDYLHHDCGRPTVHCDLKPSNILLDDDMTALLGDFGIARFYADSSSTSTCSLSTIGLKGTIGYIPPEYGDGGRASTSGDVYSFGVVLLEMFTGKRPTHPMFKDGSDIVKFVESNFPDQILQVIDPRLMDECKDVVPENAAIQWVTSLLQVALSCTRAPPRERVNMKQIATKLHAIKT